MKTTLNGSRLNVISFSGGSAAQQEAGKQDLVELKYVAKTKLNLASHLHCLSQMGSIFF